MSFFLQYPALAAVLFILLFGGALYGFLELGRRRGRRQIELDPTGSRTGLGAMEASLYGLFGLLLAFHFGGATNRFVARRDQVGEEIKIVRTLWRRLDHLPAPARDALRARVRQHVSDHLKAYTDATTVEGFRNDMERLKAFEDQMWTETLAAVKAPGADAYAATILGSMIALFDSRAARTAAIDNHLPAVIHAMFFTLAFVVAFMVGFGLAEAKVRNWTHIGGFLVIVTLAVYVIMDLEFPRLGLIRVDFADEQIRALLQTLK